MVSRAIFCPEVSAVWNGTVILPLEKGAGGIFLNDPGIPIQPNGGAAYQKFMLGDPDKRLTRLAKYVIISV